MVTVDDVIGGIHDRMYYVCTLTICFPNSYLIFNDRNML